MSKVGKISRFLFNRLRRKENNSSASIYTKKSQNTKMGHKSFKIQSFSILSVNSVEEISSFFNFEEYIRDPNNDVTPFSSPLSSPNADIAATIPHEKQIDKNGKKMKNTGKNGTKGHAYGNRNTVEEQATVTRFFFGEYDEHSSDSTCDATPIESLPTCTQTHFPEGDEQNYKPPSRNGLSPFLWKLPWE